MIPEEFSVCGTVPIALASVLVVPHNQPSNDHKAPSNNKYKVCISYHTLIRM